MSFDDLMSHIGHELECVSYGDPAVNVAIECMTCGAVLVDYEKDEEEA